MSEAREIKAAQKDRQQFEVLYNRYYEAVFRFCYQRSKDYDTAGDLTSRVFIKAMTNLGKYRDLKKPFSSWLFTIAFNVINDFYRKSNRERTVRLNPALAKTILPDDVPENGDLNLKLGRALNELKDSDLSLIEMKYFEGRSHDEICEILNINAGNARIRLHRAMGKLRKIYMETLNVKKS